MIELAGTLFDPGIHAISRRMVELITSSGGNLAAPRAAATNTLVPDPKVDNVSS
jgi:hypothetical protein